jgi:hypothetical protein
MENIKQRRSRRLLGVKNGVIANKICCEEKNAACYQQCRLRGELFNNHVNNPDNDQRRDNDTHLFLASILS